MKLKKKDFPDAEISEESLPGQTLLKHAFFQLKIAEDAYTKAKEKNELVQKRYAKTKADFDRQNSKKRKAAAVECERITVQDEEKNTSRLARRNQINRKRKNIKSFRIKRSEEHLPEAGSALFTIDNCNKTSCFSFVWL